jgi:hypothetical protein
MVVARRRNASRWCGASDDGRPLGLAEIAGDDFATASTTEALDQRPDVAGVQHLLVVADVHGL